MQPIENLYEFEWHINLPSLTRKTIYILIYYLLFFVPLSAQEKFHDHFTVDDGLPSNVIYKIIQDGDGFIWVCTEKGVVRYDGYRFQAINRINEKLRSKDVWELIIDRYQRKWFFTMDDDPIIMTQGIIKKLSELSGSGKERLKVWSLNSKTLKYATNNNFLLLNYQDTLAYYLNERNSLIELPIPKSLIKLFMDRSILSCSFYSSVFEVLHIGGSIEKYDIQSGKRVYRNSLTSIYDRTNVHQEENFAANTKQVYFSDHKNLYKLGRDSITTLKYNVDQEPPFTIIGTNTASLFLKENDIIYTLDKKSGSTKVCFTKRIRGARQVFEDQEKNIWVASQEDGVYLIPCHAKKTQIYDETNGLPHPKITTMAFDKQGLLYLGNNYGTTFSVFDGKKFNQLPKNNRKDYFIHVDDNKDIWLSGINIISKNKISTSNLKLLPRLESFKHNKLIVNKLWLSMKAFCYTNDYLYTGGRTLYSYKLNKGILDIDSIWTSEYTIYALETKSDRELLIGTTNGVYTFDTQTEEVKKIEGTYLNGNIRSIQYYKNTIWAATDKNGLVTYDIRTGKSKIIPTLSTRTISHIHFDSLKSNLWLSSSTGLVKLKIDKDNRITEIQDYTTTHGLPVNEVNYCLTKGEQVYVGTARGLAIMKDQDLNTSYRSQIHITKLRINDNERELKTSYNLPHNENHIIITLTALSYGSLRNIKYRYKLQGADDKWSISTTRTFDYPNLPPGDYTFLAEAFDANGQKTANQIRIAINIKPPIVQTWWFRSILALLLIALIGSFFYWRSKENNKKNLLEKQFSNLKLEALQSQLNSHFIFNALNAIQAYIIQKDERQASKYMSQFAKLMRAFLDSSRNRTINLTDEIEFIQTYISLEQIIYEGKFESKVVIDPLLDLNQKIPSNIVQPFVENAILHGLMPLKRPGYLTIYFTASDQYVVQCKIEDNGIGYYQSQKNNTIKSKSHGQNIIHERIAILKKNHDLEVDIETIDRMKESKQEGTIIIINFKNNGAD